MAANSCIRVNLHESRNRALLDSEEPITMLNFPMEVLLSSGKIKFPHSRNDCAKYIRIRPNASVFDVQQILINQCGGPPSLVLSITGGAKAFNMNPRLERAFDRGLLKVAQTSGTWIITGGMNKGIMQIVGQLIGKYSNPARPIHLIGVMAWGCVSGHEQIESTTSTVRYFQPDSETIGRAPLEPNHTQFIFVDDGTKGKYGGEIEFVGRLQRALAGGTIQSRTTSYSSFENMGEMNNTLSQQNEPNSKRTPIVLIVVEGGRNTLRTVYEAVYEHNIPAIFMNGSGRFCDVFADAYHKYKKYKEYKEHTSKMFEANTSMSSSFVSTADEKNNDMTEESPKKSEDRFAVNDGEDNQRKNRRSEKEIIEQIERKMAREFVDRLEACFAGKEKNKHDSREKRDDARENEEMTESVGHNYKMEFELMFKCISERFDLLHIITLDRKKPTEPEIDVAILRALLNVSKKGSNKNNIAEKREQLRLALEWDRADVAEHHIVVDETQWQDVVTNELFALALSWNRSSFVQLFLEHRFSLSNFFADQDPKVKEIILQLEQRAKDSVTKLKQGDSSNLFVEEKIYPLLQHFFEVDDASVRFPKALPAEFPTMNEINVNYVPNRQAKYDLDFGQKLFLWAVVTGQEDLAMFFWARGRKKISTALIATLFFKKLSNIDSDSGHFQTALEFENLAVKSLHRFQQANPEIYQDAIVRQIHAYGGTTWLQLAVAADAKEFVAHQAVQTVLNNIWFGYIDENTSNLHVVLVTMLPCFFLCLTYDDDLVMSRLDNKSTEATDLNQSCSSTRQRSRQPRNASNRKGDPSEKSLIDDGLRVKPKKALSNRKRGFCTRFWMSILTTCQKLRKFISAPYVNYLYNLYFQVIFLVLFSYMILCDFFPLYDFPAGTCGPTIGSAESQFCSSDADGGNSDGTVDRRASGSNMTSVTAVSFALQTKSGPSNIEIIILIWVISLTLEEIRQIFEISVDDFLDGESIQIWPYAKIYIRVFWNRLDVLAIVLYFVGFSLRFINSGQCFCAARIILAVDLTIWFMRILHIFTAVKRLGPKLVMIQEMFLDLKFFMIILAVFILSFGIAAHSLIYGVQEFSWHLIRRVINVAYWAMFGEVEILPKFEQDFGAVGYAVFILLVWYMAIVGILLVNLLIAMFTNIFDRLQTDTDRIWKFQQYFLVYEYLSRPVLPPPFILIIHAWRLSFFLLSQCCKSKWLQKKYLNYHRRMKFQKLLETKLIREIQTYEDAAADEVYYNYLKTRGTPSDNIDLDDNSIQSPQEIALEKIRNLEVSMRTINTQMQRFMEQIIERMNEEDADLAGLKTDLLNREKSSDDELEPSTVDVNHRLCSSRSNSGEIQSKRSSSSSVKQKMDENDVAYVLNL